MSNDNTVKTENGIEIYENNIMYFADEYISSLPDPDRMNDNNKGLFTGMIKYIYNHYFKNIKLDYSNINALDNIFNIYTELCYRYNKRPTILNYCILTGISMDTLNTWKTGEYRGGLGSPHSETVKKWLQECESALLDGAIENNSIGCIFALKANYGYAETAPVQAPERKQLESLEQIEQRYKLSDNNTQLPPPKAEF